MRSITEPVVAAVPSQYNVRIHDRDGVWRGVLNTSTGNYLIVNNREQEMLAAGAGPESVQHVDVVCAQRLLEYGLLVSPKINEVLSVAHGFHTSRAVRSAPLLTISPTLDCNFGCEYCFESHRPGAMSSEVQDALVRFVETVMLPNSPHDDSMDITWFGGEPLMALHVIESLTQAFRGLQQRGVLGEIKADMITNGLMLRPGIVERLKVLGLTHLQVTLDGPRELHDQRRVLKRNRGPSFDRILANLQRLAGEIPVVLRMNADRTNIHRVSELLEQLKVAGLETLTLNIDRVSPFRLEEVEDPSEILTSSEFAAWQLEHTTLALDFPSLRIHDPRPKIMGICQVDRENSFVVDPNGGLMKCWAELGNRPHVVAHLLDESTWHRVQRSPLSDRDPFDDADCVSCSVLPMCLGSCPILRQNRRAHGLKECPSIKYNLPELTWRRQGGREQLRKKLAEVQCSAS